MHALTGTLIVWITSHQYVDVNETIEFIKNVHVADPADINNVNKLRSDLSDVIYEYRVDPKCVSTPKKA